MGLKDRTLKESSKDKKKEGVVELGSKVTYHRDLLRDKIQLFPYIIYNQS